MLSDANGCVCHLLQSDARPCYACSERAKSHKKCKRCGIGLFGEGPYCTEHDTHVR